jgi:hypothetical protein
MDHRNDLLLLAHIGLLAITVKLYTEILKDRKFDVRERRSGPSTPGTPGHDGGRRAEPVGPLSFAAQGEPNRG